MILLMLKDSNPKCNLVVKLLLFTNSNGKERTSPSCHCKHISRILSCLIGCARSGAPIAVRKTAKLSTNPKSTYNDAVNHAEKFILGAADKGLVL